MDKPNPWQGIEEFNAVVETGSFTQAAQKLSVSVAHISRQVTQLEKRLKCALLLRSTRKLTLTPQGGSFYRDCQKAVDALSEAHDRISATSGEVAGVIRLGLAGEFSERRVCPALLEFMDEYPDIDIQASFNHTEADLIDGKLDFAIGSPQMNDGEWVSRSLATKKFVCVAAPTYLKQEGIPQTVDDLDTHNCIIGDEGIWEFSVDGEDKAVRVQGRYHVTNVRAQIAAAVAGKGLVAAPQAQVAKYIKQGALEVVLAKYQPKEKAIWLVHPNRSLPVRVQTLIDYLFETFADQSSDVKA